MSQPQSMAQPQKSISQKGYISTPSSLNSPSLSYPLPAANRQTVVSGGHAPSSALASPFYGQMLQPPGALVIQSPGVPYLSGVQQLQISQTSVSPPQFPKYQLLGLYQQPLAATPKAPMHAPSHQIDPFIRHVKHTGQADAKKGDVLVAVVVSICSGSSYDNLFREVPQVSAEGTRVAVYQATDVSVPFIMEALKDKAKAMRAVDGAFKHLADLIADIDFVQPDAVVFNWECCSGCGTPCGGYGCMGGPASLGPDPNQVMELTKVILDAGHMAMFSDFSLKALIKEWKEESLGPNPFVQIGELNSGFQLRFDPQVLNGSPSAQLQKLGELCNEGEATVKAMGATIVYTVNSSKKSNLSYDLQILTVMSSADGTPCQPEAGLVCETSSHRGAAGHVLLTYPSGGRLLTSAGHWIELTRLDVSMESLLRVAEASYGAAYSAQIQTSLAQCSTAAERSATIQSCSAQMVQQSAPCSYSVRPAYSAQ